MTVSLENIPVLIFSVIGSATRSPYQTTFGPARRTRPQIKGTARPSVAVGTLKSPRPAGFASSMFGFGRRSSVTRNVMTLMRSMTQKTIASSYDPPRRRVPKGFFLGTNGKPP